jgi:hypothetical protein
MRRLALLLLVAGCASEPPPPAGPGLLVLPGTGKSFDLFLADDRECRQFASSQVSGAAQQSDSSSRSVQQRYDFGYTQCMYAKGHKVPVAGRYSDKAAAPRGTTSVPPPPPPPPEGKPPGPPPDYKG